VTSLAHVNTIIEELRKVFGSGDEGGLAERLVLAYKDGGTRAVRLVLHEYLKTLGVNVESRES
jgi:hypothetical protein